MRYALSSLVLVALLFSLGCGDDEGGPTDSGTAIPGTDAGTPVPGTDAGTPIPGTDSGTPIPGTDSGTPIPGTDSGTPIPGTDSGMTDPGMRDPRLQTNPNAGEVTCGTMTCSVPAQTCCTTLFPQGQTCGAPSSCSGGTSAPGNCDGPEDCSGGQICCAPSGFVDLTQGTTCGATCGSRFRMCHTNADCAGGETCHTCRPPMGMGNIVGLCNAGSGCPGSYMTL